MTLTYDAKNALDTFSFSALMLSLSHPGLDGETAMEDFNGKCAVVVDPTTGRYCILQQWTDGGWSISITGYETEGDAERAARIYGWTLTDPPAPYPVRGDT
jgi:hypothetical protein